MINMMQEFPVSPPPKPPDLPGGEGGALTHTGAPPTADEDEPVDLKHALEEEKKPDGHMIIHNEHGHSALSLPHP